MAASSAVQKVAMTVDLMVLKSVELSVDKMVAKLGDELVVLMAAT